MRRFIAKSVNVLFCLFSTFMIVRSDFYVKKYEARAKEAAETAHYAAGIAMQAASSASSSASYNTDVLTNRRPGKLYSDQETEVHTIGIYESQRGTVNVHVEEKRYPVILVLMAYEQTRWHVSAPHGNVVAIVLGGYKEQNVTGIEGIPIHTYTYMPSNCHCYKGKDHFYFYNLKEKQSFVNTMYSATGKIPMTFQTSYSSGTFKVSASTPKLDISDLKYIPR